MSGVKKPRAPRAAREVEPVQEEAAPRAVKAPAKVPVKAEPVVRTRAEPTRRAAKADAPGAASEADWNGPVPGFLGFSALN